MRVISRIIAGWLIAVALIASAEADVSLRTFIERFEAQTGYRFLYPDALIAGKRIDANYLSDATTWTPALEDVFLRMGIGVQVDVVRRQVLLFRARDAASMRSGPLRGRVSDAATGTPLGFATIQWGGPQPGGVIADADGYFIIPAAVLARGVVQIRVSFVGFRALDVRINENNTADLIAIRLTPDIIVGPAVLVRSASYRLPTDTLIHTFTRIGQYGSFGEGSAIRTLQPLASVGLNGAISTGLHVRGSTADALLVLLDGVPVYNQQHLFGLFDAFNKDALQTVGFYYDVVPADLSGPPGATMAFETRTGSQTGLQGRVGLSSSTIRTTLEGPLGDGRGSWLGSIRYAYLDQLDWFGNEKLLTWGLNIDRAYAEPAPGTTDITTSTVTPTDWRAHFYDLHLKAGYETTRAGHWSVNTYFGADDTWQQANRLTRLNGGGIIQPGTISESQVETGSAWASQMVSLRHRLYLPGRGTLRTIVGGSFYQADFSKDDFLYTRVIPGINQTRPFYATLTQDNRLTHLMAGIHLDAIPTQGHTLKTGLMANLYTVSYRERSATRPLYTLDTESAQIDAYAQYDLTRGPYIHWFAGIRAHYYTLGNLLRMSPRLQLRLFPESGVQAGLGYSRNYQFLHRISLKNTSSAPVWVANGAGQRPTHVDNYTAGLYLPAVWAGAYFQVEAYLKHHRYVRVHEINNSLLSSRINLLDTPWFADSGLQTTGLEVQMHQTSGQAEFSLSYTWSESRLQNDALNNGRSFYTNWDRRHQAFAAITMHWSSRFSSYVSGVYATGLPSYTVSDAQIITRRLGDYQRMDAGVRFRQEFRMLGIEMALHAFNITHRMNPWYQDAVTVVDRRVRPAQLVFQDLDVYDLGFHPSFDLVVRW
jgi:hypothetical protein